MGLLGRGKTAEQPAIEKQHHDAHPLGDDDTGKIVDNTVRGPSLCHPLYDSAGFLACSTRASAMTSPRVAYFLNNGRASERVAAAEVCIASGTLSFPPDGFVPAAESL